MPISLFEQFLLDSLHPFTANHLIIKESSALPVRKVPFHLSLVGYCIIAVVYNPKSLFFATLVVPAVFYSVCALIVTFALLNTVHELALVSASVVNQGALVIEGKPLP